MYIVTSLQIEQNLFSKNELIKYMYVPIFLVHVLC